MHMGCLTAGIVPVAIQHTRTLYEIKKIIKHSRSTVLFVIGHKQFMKLKKERIPTLEQTILLDSSEKDQSWSDRQVCKEELNNKKKQVMSWKNFLKQSGKIERGGFILNDRMKELRGDQLAVITYSSAQLQKNRKGYALYCHCNEYELCACTNHVVFVQFYIKATRRAERNHAVT